MNPSSEVVVKPILTRPFLTVVGLMVCALILSGPVANRLGINAAKKSLPLKARLSTLDETSLLPYRVVERVILDATMVESLDTSEYINWILEDTSLPKNHPLRLVTLLVTYYTGANNIVLHKPDVCYYGAGYQPAQPHEETTIRVTGIGETIQDIPIRVLSFSKTQIHDQRKVSVVYNFYCNGRFVANSLRVRLLLNSLTSTYAYFSKVEVSFPRATREQNVEGVVKLFNRVLPVLLRDHWPDFEAAERAAKQGKSE